MELASPCLQWERPPESTSIVEPVLAGATAGAEADGRERTQGSWGPVGVWGPMALFPWEVVMAHCSPIQLAGGSSGERHTAAGGRRPRHDRHWGPRGRQ